MKKRKLSMLVAAALLVTMIPTGYHQATGSLGSTVAKAETKIAAFPGAEGGGKYTTGGRGGTVYYVTNLNDSGTGSFRDAVSGSNRIVVFKVGGTIELKSDVVVKSNVTVAGQTAPGGAGITLKNYKIGLGGSNIILRYVSSRPGERGTSADYDAFGGSDGSNCIVDHCSIGWANDEQWGLYSNNDYNTVQWSVIGPSNSFSYHSKGIHGFGIMLGKSNCTWHHNMVVHNVSRNFRGKVEGTNTADFVNNVIYDWGYQTAYGTIGHMNYVGNYLKIGQSTGGGYNYMCIDSTTKPENFGLYLSGNRMVTVNGLDYKTLSSNNWTGITYGSSNGRNESNVKSTSPYSIMVNGEDVSMAKKAESADDAYEHVLDYAGAGINVSSRPAIDQQVMTEAETGTGTLTGARPYSDASDTQKTTLDKYKIACGTTYTYPSAVTSGVPMDTDGDGMPDDWEIARGLNPNSKYASDGSLESNGDYCGKGYTNIEYYINDLTVDSFPSGVVEVSPTTGAQTTATPSTTPTVTSSAVATATPTASAVQGTEIKEGIYQIQNVNSGLYLNVTGGTAANGTNVQQWGSSSAAPYDSFKIVSSGDGYYKIYSMLEGGGTYLLDVSGVSAANGANVIIFKDKDGVNQQFKFVAQGDGTYAIMTKVSSDASCLDVENYSKSSGANVYQWQFNGTTNQLWRLIAVETGTTVSPSVSPSVEPSLSPSPEMSVSPSVSPSPSISPSPSLSPSPVTTASPVTTSAAPVTSSAASSGVKVTVTGNDTDATNCLTKTIQFTGTSVNEVDLSKVKIRYYYTADGTNNQSVWVDSASLTYQKAPYYVNIASDVTVSCVKMGTAVSKADHYLEASFTGDYKVNNTVNGQIALRVAKDDWSMYTQSNDYSFGDDKKVVVYYDGKVIWGEEP